MKVEAVKAVGEGGQRGGAEQGGLVAAEALVDERRAWAGAADAFGPGAFVFAGAAAGEGEEAEEGAHRDDDPGGRAAGDKRGLAQADIHGGGGEQGVRSAAGNGWRAGRSGKGGGA